MGEEKLEHRNGVIYELEKKEVYWSMDREIQVKYNIKIELAIHGRTHQERKRYDIDLYRL